MAKVLSSISGNLISAASAGYAPTNSADVSAIASAYQVVSATATQLYAGTAFLTGVNGAPVSASRAGNAANASLANSAYYDGTGRLISALPDSAAVSSIASSYAESAASSKADSSSLSSYALSADVSGVIDTVSANSASWSGGGTVSVDSNMSGDGYNTPLGLSPVVKLSASGSAGYVYIHGGSGSFTVSGNTARFQGTGKNNMNVSFNCDPDKKAALFIGPWVASNNWAGVSAQYTAGNINMNIRASGSGSAGLTLWDSAGSAQMQKSSIPYWDGKLDSSASSSFYTTANESGYVGSSYVDSAVSGKADSSSLSSYALSSDVSGVIDTVSANSASWGGGSLPITGTSGDDSANYDASSIMFTRYDTAGEPDIRTAMLTPDSLWMDYTLDGNDHTSMTLNESMLTFTIPGGDRWVDAYAIDSWNSAVDTVANNSATWGQGGVDSATVSAIASSYAESAASAKADSSALSAYALSSDVSGVIDTVSANSASWGGGATGDYVEKSATEVAIGSLNTASSYSLAQGTGNRASSRSFAQGAGNSASSYSLAQGTGNKALYYSFAQGSQNSAYDYSFAQGRENRASSYSLAQGTGNKASSRSFAQGDGNLVSSYSFAQGYYNTASGSSFAQGIYISAKNTAAVFGQYNLRGDGDTATGNSAAFAIGDGTATGARHDLMVVTKDGEITMYSSTADTTGTGIMSAIRAISAAATGGGIDSATCSAIASSYAESAASSKLDTTAFNSGDFYTTANESGYVGSAYVDSAVSGKMDSSAIDYTRTGGGTQIYASGTGSSTNQFSAKNGSAGAAIIAGENARLRLWDTAATANLYASSIGGWNAASNLVSSQSANWGGSALQLSAGLGVKLEMSGNTLVVKADETLLWSGANTSAATLSEPYSNFERIGVVLGFPSQGKTHHVFEAASATQLMYAFGQTNAYLCAIKCGITDGTAFTVNDAKYVWTPYGTSTQVATDTGNVASARNCLVKIYGINRTASSSPAPDPDDNEDEVG